jgi:hypothetical protein
LFFIIYFNFIIQYLMYWKLIFVLFFSFHAIMLSMIVRLVC